MLLSELGEKNVLAVRCDVTKSEDVKNLINQAVKKFGKINILVNNAGKNPARLFTIEDTTEEEWDELSGYKRKGLVFSFKICHSGNQESWRWL